MNFLAKVGSKEKFGTKFFVVSFSLLTPPEINFEAGQCVSFEVKKGVKRIYSISSPPFIKNSIELLIDFSPGGVGSKFFENMQVGDKVNFLGPFGHFVLPKEIKENTHFYFLATGSGVAPFRSQTLYLQKNYPNNKVSLFFGTRFEENIVPLSFQRKLESILTSDFEYRVLVSKPSADWKGEVGYVTNLLEREVVFSKDSVFYICGKKEMIEDCIKILEKKGFAKEQIRVEKFGR